MKKGKILCIVLVFAMILSNIPAYAAEKNSQDETMREVFANSYFVEKNSTGYVFESDYNPVINSRSPEGEVRAHSVITIMPSDDKDEQILNSLVTSRANSNYREAWDSSGGVKAYSTVYYTVRTDVNSGLEYSKLSYVTGGYTNYDNSLSISNKTVYMGQIDGSHMGQRASYNFTGNSFTYYPLSSWAEINSSQSALLLMGVTISMTITRRSSPWYFDFPNAVYGAINPW